MMGLMYVLPISDDGADGDRVEVLNDGQKSTLILKSYGLPMIFWGYLAAALSVLALMWLASRAVIIKLLTYDDPTLLFLGHLVQYTLILSPIILLAFFFYEKLIYKNGVELKIIHRLFFIPVWLKKYKLDAKDAITVNHYMESPNMARLRRQQGLAGPNDMKQFENKGYYELMIISKGKSYFVDRHSRKVDLLKMKDLLSKY